MAVGAPCAFTDFTPLRNACPGGRGVNFEVPLTDALDDQGVNNSNVLI
jgi:hypothetical protein